MSPLFAAAIALMSSDKPPQSVPGPTPVPVAEPVRLPAGDSAAWRSRMLDWSAPAAPDPVSPLPPSLRMEKPVGEGRLTSAFGTRDDPFDRRARAHRGVDIAAPVGTPVVASADGTVTFAGVAGGYGRLIQIDHPSGMQLRYGHLSQILTRVGHIVRRGEVIGAMGSTGRSTGSHLHFEIRVDGMAVDPRRPLPLAAPIQSTQITISGTDPVRLRWPGPTASADRLPAAYR